MLSSKVHGYIDYLIGVVLIILPFILNFSSGVAIAVAIILGVSTIAYILITDYELVVA